MNLFAVFPARELSIFGVEIMWVGFFTQLYFSAL